MQKQGFFERRHFKVRQTGAQQCQKRSTLLRRRHRGIRVANLAALSNQNVANAHSARRTRAVAAVYASQDTAKQHSGRPVDSTKPSVQNKSCRPFIDGESHQLHSNEENNIHLNAAISLKPPCLLPIITVPTGGQIKKLVSKEAGLLELSATPSIVLSKVHTYWSLKEYQKEELFMPCGNLQRNTGRTFYLRAWRPRQNVGLLYCTLQNACVLCGAIAV